MNTLYFKPLALILNKGRHEVLYWTYSTGHTGVCNFENSTLTFRKEIAIEQ